MYRDQVLHVVKFGKVGRQIYGEAIKAWDNLCNRPCNPDILV